MLKNSLVKIKDEKGITLLEGLVSLFITVLLIVGVISIFTLGVGKKNYIDEDIEYSTFERNIDKWLETDYRENIVKSIEVSGTTIDYILNNGNTIRYSQKDDYYYRTLLKADEDGVIGLEKAIDSIKLGKVKIEKVTYCNTNIEDTLKNPTCQSYGEDTVLINVDYRLGVNTKNIPVYLSK